MLSVTANLSQLLEARTVVGRTCLSELPEDMQQLVMDFAAEAGQDGSLDWDASMDILEVPTAAFPVVAGDTQGYRNLDYVDAFDTGTMPPVLLSGKAWVDGWHRVEKARRVKAPTVRALDLSKVGLKLKPMLGTVRL